MQIDKRFDECGLANHWISKWKQGKSLKYRGLFDVAAIHEINAKDFGNLTNAESELVYQTCSKDFKKDSVMMVHLLLNTEKNCQRQRV